MVLKRKQGDEFVESTSFQEPGIASEEGPPVKKTRTNPPRSKAKAKATTTAATKKIRAPRKKQAANPVEVAEAPLTAAAGPSSLPQAGPSQPSVPAKRGRKKNVQEDEQPGPEKRKAQFKPKCPQNILDRVERVMTQRFFMINRHRNDGELREDFSVLGSTGNVYTVTIDHLPRCNCPDAVRGNHCKHILFIFLKVLGVARQSEFWYQKALLTSELEQIFRDARSAPNAPANERILEAYARATGKAVEEPANNGNKRMPGEDDDCPICYDAMHGVPDASLVFCEDCGNAVHNECFGEWKKSSQNTGKELTCVYCRARWVIQGPSGSGTAKRPLVGYLNLGAVAGVSPVRDTSTYYHGPRRGQRLYGFQEYDD